MAASNPAFGLVSPCGWGNLGDAAIQDSTIAHLRERHPGARFVGFTLNPADTTERHGIPALPISGVSFPTYLVALPPAAPSATDRFLGRLEAARGGYRLGRALRGAWGFLQGDRRHTEQVRSTVDGLSAIIVSGGGQLDDLWGGPWGHPYALWKWSRMAGDRDIPFVILSVGAGSLRSPLSRTFIGNALRRARYRSYRDTRSRDLVRELGFDHDVGPVVPDLAFGYDMPRTTRPPSSSTVVGVSPIAFRDPRVWPTPDAAGYDHYLTRLATFIRRTASGERTVVLFTTDTSDVRVVADLAARVQGAGVTVVPTPTLPALAAALARVDVVVASRLHGVLLAHLAGRPVLALSYDWKVDRHMEDLGQSRFRMSIDDPSPQVWSDGLERLLADRERAGRAIAAGVSRARAQVLAQFAAVAG